MTDINLIKLPECPKFLDEGVAPATKEIGVTLGNIFYAIFSPINYNAEKLRIRHAANLKKYQSDIQNELRKISEEKLIEPPFNIVGPALEASKFYIDQEDMRKMFAKLIASSMNIDTSSDAHHSYVEIIKQLSPLDASNLRYLYYINSQSHSIVKYKRIIAANEWKILLSNVLLTNPLDNDIYAQAKSVTNLKRLGLIDTNYEAFVTDDNAYLVYVNESICQYFYKQNIRHDQLDIEKGYIEITPFGRDFSKICI